MVKLEIGLVAKRDAIRKEHNDEDEDAKGVVIKEEVVDPDDEEGSESDESPAMSMDEIYFKSKNGEWFYASTSFGPSTRLLNVRKFMAFTSHSYQLKAAAQAHWLCESQFKGILLGDGDGFGKDLDGYPRYVPGQGRPRDFDGRCSQDALSAMG
ncbi:hypothetical protein VTI74DRAFT_1189 [Chaetomium olivicolor]